MSMFFQIIEARKFILKCISYHTTTNTSVTIFLTGDSIASRLQDELNVGVCERRSPSPTTPLSVSHGELIKQLKKDFGEVMEKLYRNLDEAKVKVTADLGQKFDRTSDKYIGKAILINSVVRMTR